MGPARPLRLRSRPRMAGSASPSAKGSMKPLLNFTSTPRVAIISTIVTVSSGVSSFLCSHSCVSWFKFSKEFGIGPTSTQTTWQAIDERIENYYYDTHPTGISACMRFHKTNHKSIHVSYKHFSLLPLKEFQERLTTCRSASTPTLSGMQPAKHARSHMSADLFSCKYIYKYLTTCC